MLTVLYEETSIKYSVRPVFFSLIDSTERLLSKDFFCFFQTDQENNKMAEVNYIKNVAIIGVSSFSFHVTSSLRYEKKPKLHDFEPVILKR